MLKIFIFRSGHITSQGILYLWLYLKTYYVLLLVPLTAARIFPGMVKSISAAKHVPDKYEPLLLCLLFFVPYTFCIVRLGGDTPAVGPVNIGYKTGSDSKWKGTTDTNNSLDYTLIQFTATTDSDNGALDPTDLDNLQIGVEKSIHSNLELRVTEVAVEVEYLP